ncbi:uncharacterized protein N7459_007344 [Penicillium hispanicum]|uniref:uncharacterized protein n=1 Tax=Penicillium hispanicum TaxID=1080232 RepID=UPI00254119E7|nr:uncharacterized protein N7459_007344 [Penicillium hispanicum]KAJ5578380.1 hypothetical protein N7459_007344 [Penicillium hispanicum]
MASLIVRAASLFLLISPALSFAPCPLLGPAYPPFTLNTTDPVIASSMKKLTKQFDSLVKTDNGPNGPVSPNTTFSIALFSSNEGNGEDKPFFWQYHYTSPALKKASSNAKNVTADSIYRIGGLTEVFTVWSLLLTQGDQILSDPVTKYLPELAKTSTIHEANLDPVGHTRWDEITVGQLASHMSGLARDYCSSDLTTQTGIPKAGLPPHPTFQLPCCGDKKCSNDDFIQNFASRMPVAPSGQTPSYSNMAFQILGYIIEKQNSTSFNEVVQKQILDKLKLTKTTIFAPEDSSNGVIPISKEASGWSARNEGDAASKSMFSSAKDLAIAGKAILRSSLLSPAQTRRWLKPVTHTSNPVNSVGAPWVIYSDNEQHYPNTSMVDVYSVLSNEGDNEGLYSSYMGLVPDFGVGYAILSADTISPADLNAHADYMEVVLEGVMKTALKQAAVNYGGLYSASSLDSHINVTYDSLPGLYIEQFVSNGTNFRETLAEIAGITNGTDLSIRLYPTHLSEKTDTGSRQAFRAVLQDITELADNGTPTCVSWMDLDKYQYGGHSLDEFIFTLDSTGKAVSVEIPALEVTLDRKK